jgi:mannose-6-phosphate isomerase
MAPLRPVLLDRRALPKIWGGRMLDEVLGVALEPASEPIGETWEVYDRPDGSSGLRGLDATLASWMASARTEVLGRGVRPGPGGRFPLLLKFIDAREALSIQVHPGPDLAALRGDGPKSEAWIVLAAGPRARIVRGFREGVTPEDVARATAAGGLEELLHSFTPRVGDVIPVPAGCVHAIGPDVVVFEVQQNSDLTFRLWDWGRPRELHVEDALRALRFDPPAPVRSADEAGDVEATLLDTEDFRVRRLSLDRPATVGTEGVFKLFTVVEGMAALGWRSGGEHPPIPVRRGDTVLVPAAVDAVYVSPIGRVGFLVTDPGGRL